MANPPPVASLQRASDSDSEILLKLSKDNVHALLADMARSLSSFGVERKGAVEGSVIAFITLKSVDLADPCSPVTASMG